MGVDTLPFVRLRDRYQATIEQGAPEGDRNASAMATCRVGFTID